MYRKTRNITVTKPNSVGCGKRGFTLVELSVVLALVVILTGMTVSFSVLMNGYAAESKAEYGFLENHADLKDALCDWLAEMDTQGNSFSVLVSGEKNGKLYFNGTTEVKFENGTLWVGNEALKSGLDNIDKVDFEITTKPYMNGVYINGVLIKCTTYREENGQTVMENSFVFARRYVGGS